MFSDHKNCIIIQQELEQKNIKISLRHIGYLAKRFVVYLSIAHKQSQIKLKQHMQSKGGYILHLDGTCEGAEPHIFSAIDAISDIVLDNQKMATENSRCISTMLKRIKTSYNNPLAIVSDMKTSISHAVEKVFPDVNHYICHYHFLRDIGKDLFEHDHNTVRRHIKTLRTRSTLRRTARQLKKTIDSDEKLAASLQTYLDTQNVNPLTPTTKSYILVSWIIEASSASGGYGFPFDQPHLDFYLRLKEAYPVLKTLKQQGASELPLVTLQRAISDLALSSTVERMCKKVEVFNALRTAMKIACSDDGNGLNDEGDGDMQSVQHNVAAFRQSEEIKRLSKEYVFYRKMTNQIDKYWDKLFAAPISVVTPSGEVEIQPQRTNNNMEQSFRFLKHGERKKTGQKNLNKAMKAMLADTPLIRNLSNPNYMAILLNGKVDLAERFADIDIQLVHEREKENRARWQKYPKRMARLFKLRNLPQKLVVNQPIRQDCG